LSSSDRVGDGVISTSWLWLWLGTNVVSHSVHISNDKVRGDISTKVSHRSHDGVSDNIVALKVALSNILDVLSDISSVINETEDSLGI